MVVKDGCVVRRTLPPKSEGHVLRRTRRSRAGIDNATTVYIRNGRLYSRKRSVAGAG